MRHKTKVGHSDQVQAQMIHCGRENELGSLLLNQGINRAELNKALVFARARKATLLIARLDRFSRRVSFIARIMDEGISLCCAEMPNASEFQLHIFAALAEEEN
jgi:DNA invertase Pin-like site-specific DNA recombinase